MYYFLLLLHAGVTGFPPSGYKIVYPISVYILEQFENVPTYLGITIMFFSSATLIKVFSPLNYLRICSDLFSTRK